MQSKSQNKLKDKQFLVVEMTIVAVIKWYFQFLLNWAVIEFHWWGNRVTTSPLVFVYETIPDMVGVVQIRCNCSASRAQFTNKLSIIIQIQWKLCFAVKF